MIRRNTPTTFIAVLALATTGLLSGQADAQSRQIPAPEQTAPIILHSATVHTVAGNVINEGYVVMSNGVVTMIGQGSPPSLPGATRRDATGLHIYPGLVGANTQLGLTETGAVDVTQDLNELGDFTPEARAVIAINPDSDLLPVTRANGILTAMTVPSGGTLPGRCALIRLDGWTWEQLAIDPVAGLAMSWPRARFGGFRFGGFGGRGFDPAEMQKRYQESVEKIEEFFDDAIAYARAKDAGVSAETDLRFEAMRPFVSGDKPIFVNATSQGQIEAAVAFAVRRDLNIVIVGGYEADRCTALLAKHDIPVIINGLHRLPSARHADYDEPFTLPLRLYEAGVKFCIASGAGAAHERNLNHVAATASAYGLPKDEALKAVTIGAAEILGVGDTLGSIETGKAATVIITTGDPLEITTDVVMAFIDGRQIDLGSRHTQLYLKYREKYKQLGLIDDSTTKPLPVQ